MTEYALVFTNNGEKSVKKYRDFAGTPPVLRGKPLVWLPVIEVNPDAADDQIKTGPVISINANDVTRTWTVRSETFAEGVARGNREVSEITQFLNQPGMAALVKTLADDKNEDVDDFRARIEGAVWR